MTEPIDPGPRAAQITPEELLHWAEGIPQQCLDDGMKWFPGQSQTPMDMALGLCGESGEVAEVIKKLRRGSITYPKAQERMKSELADVFTYLMALCAMYEVNIIDAYHEKRFENDERFSK
jgi:NTP pyrophosphatase (non-canonical NTP hydrolase)